tara:strand:- start:924 stop:1346 length:423 start_codon:yes stop_codon:yes gene_type:complete
MAQPDKTYVRFVCFQTVERQRNRLGVFQAVHLAEDSDVAPDWALTELKVLDNWFTDNLARPARFATGRRRSSKGGRIQDGQTGLSWFKPEAVDHIRQMHRLKVALEECGIHVEVVTTRDPGKTVWQDAHQLVAEPGPRRF